MNECVEARAVLVVAVLADSRPQVDLRHRESWGCQPCEAPTLWARVGRGMSKQLYLLPSLLCVLHQPSRS